MLTRTQRLKKSFQFLAPPIDRAGGLTSPKLPAFSPTSQYCFCLHCFDRPFPLSTIRDPPLCLPNGFNRCCRRLRIAMLNDLGGLLILL